MVLREGKKRRVCVVHEGHCYIMLVLVYLPETSEILHRRGRTLIQIPDFIAELEGGTVLFGFG